MVQEKAADMEVRRRLALIYFVSRSEFAHAPELVILERLLDFRAAVHDERAVADDRLGKGLAVHDEEAGVGVRLDGDAVAVTGEDGEVALPCPASAVDEDFTTLHQERRGVAI